MSSLNFESLEDSGKKAEQEKPQQEKPAKGKLVCAWCKKELGEVEGLEEGQISHGMCPDCREKHFPKPGKN